MAAEILCAICKKRKPKRACPGVKGDICAQCCGTEREVSVDCPSACIYLRESRKYEREKPTKLAELPFKEVELSNNFVYEFEMFIGQIAYHLMDYALKNPRTVDPDIIEALDKLVRTYQTEQSGLYYESLPDSPGAIGVYRELKTFIDELQKKVQERGSVGGVKTGDLIRSLVFLVRMARVNTTERPRSRYFIDFLRATFPEQSLQQEAAKASEEDTSRLIIP
jgi:hypothetical protein